MIAATCFLPGFCRPYEHFTFGRTSRIRKSGWKPTGIGEHRQKGEISGDQQKQCSADLSGHTSGRVSAVTDQNGKYTFGPDLWRLAVGVNREVNLITIAEPIIRGYVKESNETLYLFTYSKKQLIFEFAVESSFPLRDHLELGVPYDLHVGRRGK
jgi:hypothetical protein